jgi:hypothetical protein
MGIIGVVSAAAPIRDGKIKSVEQVQTCLRENSECEETVQAWTKPKDADSAVSQ